MVTTENTILEKKKKIINLPILLLIVIILSTMGLYGYNYYIIGEKIKIDSKINEINKDILKLNKDKNIQVYNIIKKNKKILNKLYSYSEITKFRNAIKSIENKYGIKINGFNYSNGVISTKVETDSTKLSYGYLYVTKFIRKYRKDKKSIFELGFINKITGSKKLEFNLKLKVKKNNLQNNIK